SRRDSSEVSNPCARRGPSPRTGTDRRRTSRDPPDLHPRARRSRAWAALRPTRRRMQNCGVTRRSADVESSASRPAASAPGIERRSRRQDVVFLAVLVLLWAAVSLPRMHGPIDLRWDASAYYILGTSLAEGKGYRLLNEPGEIEAVQYPPLLPLIVAAHERA